ncbi:MAG TPA: hypothetical protein VF892_20355 [Pseudonocardiaceae bacterium]
MGDTFDTPIDDRYFEDYRPGAVHEFTDTVTADEQRMIEFATEFDPQPVHTDPDATRDGRGPGPIEASSTPA